MKKSDTQAKTKQRKKADKRRQQALFERRKREREMKGKQQMS